MTAHRRLLLISTNRCPSAPVGTPYAGGQVKYMRELIHALAKRNWSIDVLTCQWPDERQHVSFCENVNIYRFSAGELHQDSKGLSQQDHNNITEQILHFLAGRSQDYDAMYANYRHSYYIASAVKKAHNLPLAVILHSILAFKLEAHPDTPDKPLQETEERQFIQAADKVVVMTQAERDALAQAYDQNIEKFEIIPPAIDTNVFCYAPQPQNEKTKVLFVGKREKRKGLDTLMEAVRHLSHTNIRFTVGGAGWDQDDSITSLPSPLKDKVVCLGNIPNEKLCDVIHAHDMVIVPSHYENFGYVVAEAQAAGRLVIGSYVGGIKSNIIDGKTGMHFQSRNAADLAQKIEIAAKDKDLRGNIGKIAADMVLESYNFEKIMDTYDTVLRQMIKG